MFIADGFLFKKLDNDTYVRFDFKKEKNFNKEAPRCVIDFRTGLICDNNGKKSSFSKHYSYNLDSSSYTISGGDLKKPINFSNLVKQTFSLKDIGIDKASRVGKHLFHY